MIYIDNSLVLVLIVPVLAIMLLMFIFSLMEFLIFLSDGLRNLVGGRR